MSKAKTHPIQIKRAYEQPDPADGKRVLVERLWPRGVTKEKAALDDWLKEIAPSPELRRWYSHEVARWDEFCTRYRAELETHADLVDSLREDARQGPLTLIYAAHDQEHNSALVLRDVLEGRAE